MSYYTDEDGRLHVVDENENATPVFAKVSGGVLHCMASLHDPLPKQRYLRGCGPLCGPPEARERRQC
jgi:hypothetical protein